MIKITGIESISDNQLIADMVSMALTKPAFLELLNEEKRVDVDCTDCGDIFYGECVVRLNKKSITFNFKREIKDAMAS